MSDRRGNAVWLLILALGAAGCWGGWWLWGQTAARPSGVRTEQAGGLTGGLAAQPPRPSAPVFAPQPDPDDDFRPDFVVYRPLEPVLDPPVGSVAEAAGKIDDAEMVFGLIVAGQARAYPIGQLFGPMNEVINDTLGGQPVVVAWCGLCQNAAADSRRLGDRVLQFSAGGLWRGVLLLCEPTSGSLWSQMLGECMRGRERGEMLTQLPGIFTDWKTWSTGHPETSVMLRPRTTDQSRAEDTVYPARDHVVAVDLGGQQAAWSFEELNQQPLVQETVGGVPLLIAYDAGTSTASVLDRRVSDRTLAFRREANQLIDTETGSVWDPITGRGRTGPLAGTVLLRLPSMVSRADRWKAYHPSTVWGLGSAPSS